MTSVGSEQVSTLYHQIRTFITIKHSNKSQGSTNLRSQALACVCPINRFLDTPLPSNLHLTLIFSFPSAVSLSPPPPSVRLASSAGTQYNDGFGVLIYDDLSACVRSCNMSSIWRCSFPTSQWLFLVERDERSKGGNDRRIGVEREANKKANILLILTYLCACVAPKPEEITLIIQQWKRRGINECISKVDIFMQGELNGEKVVCRYTDTYTGHVSTATRRSTIWCFETNTCWTLSNRSTDFSTPFSPLSSPYIVKKTVSQRGFRHVLIWRQ